METQISQHDDLNLMELSELDSHLSIFEASNPGRDSSTPGAMSNSAYGDSINTIDQHSHTIIVESPSENYLPKSHYGAGSRARFADQKFNMRYVVALFLQILSFKLQPESPSVILNTAH